METAPVGAEAIAVAEALGAVLVAPVAGGSETAGALVTGAGDAAGLEHAAVRSSVAIRTLTPPSSRDGACRRRRMALP
jgi:hypothetical protein